MLRMCAGVFPPPVHVHGLLWSHGLSSLLRQMTLLSLACLTLLFYFIVCVSPSVMSNSLRPHRLRSARLLCPWNSPGKNTGVGCHTLIQGIFPIQGLNPCILHCRQILYCWATREALFYFIPCLQISSPTNLLLLSDKLSTQLGIQGFSQPGLMALVKHSFLCSSPSSSLEHDTHCWHRSFACALLCTCEWWTMTNLVEAQKEKFQCENISVAL